MIDYRHFIEELKRKPQTFKGFLLRDALFPREAYRLTWEQLDQALTRRQACKTIVALLEMAACDGVEGVLAERLDALRLAGELPDVKRLREEFAPRSLSRSNWLFASCLRAGQRAAAVSIFSAIGAAKCA